MKAQGNNYFTMKLNPETGLYVYKIIAVKELFEYPELYNSKFGYNVFSSKTGPRTKPKQTDLDVVNDPDILGAIEKELEKNKDKKAPEIKRSNMCWLMLTEK
ncbi:hypothetical protein [Niabella hibiscisoli]|uniref:hypothetical protein n=1 Tax=Niabella hibiscisoli TaxID=1825928 RepID=UPI001F0D1F3E|nr:hypothetical protein [Niabella hibiscisoli]MCH5720971.1 hypothetical protein [Niabella hibiscisoli]